MGFWKKVAYNMQQGMSQSEAIALNAKLISDIPASEKEKLLAIAAADSKINQLP